MEVKNIEDESIESYFDDDWHIIPSIKSSPSHLNILKVRVKKLVLKYSADYIIVIQYLQPFDAEFQIEVLDEIVKLNSITDIDILSAWIVFDYFIGSDPTNDDPSWLERKVKINNLQRLLISHYGINPIEFFTWLLHWNLTYANATWNMETINEVLISLNYACKFMDSEIFKLAENYISQLEHYNEDIIGSNIDNNISRDEYYGYSITRGSDSHKNSNDNNDNNDSNDNNDNNDKSCKSNKLYDKSGKSYDELYNSFTLLSKNPNIKINRVKTTSDYSLLNLKFENVLSQPSSSIPDVK